MERKVRYSPVGHWDQVRGECPAGLLMERDKMGVHVSVHLMTGSSWELWLELASCANGFCPLQIQDAMASRSSLDRSFKLLLPHLPNSLTFTSLCPPPMFLVILCHE